MIKHLKNLYSALQLKKYRNYVYSQVNKGMHLGKNVGIMPGVKFDPPHSFLTSIGDNCIIAPDVRFLNHDASTFIHLKMAKIGKIVIKENCFIGAGSILLPGIEIGPNSIIGSGSVVSRSVPPNVIAAGNPAKVIKPITDLLEKIKGDKTAFSIQSSDFYPYLLNPDKLADFKNSINPIGYTIGTDGNKDFYFNTD
jgi:maltose O-acetyltransferase